MTNLELAVVFLAHRMGPSIEDEIVRILESPDYPVVAPAAPQTPAAPVATVAVPVATTDTPIPPGVNRITGGAA